MAEFITDDLDLYKKAVEYELEQAQNEEDMGERVRSCQFCYKEIDAEKGDYEIIPNKVSGYKEGGLSGDLIVVCSQCYKKALKHAKMDESD